MVDSSPTERNTEKAKKAAYKRQKRATNLEEARAKDRAYYKANRSVRLGRVWRHRIKARYGLTALQYDTLFNAQGGACKLCNKIPTRRLAVDHDHETGKVRGLLCSFCNRRLGAIENKVFYAKALKYLAGEL